MEDSTINNAVQHNLGYYGKEFFTNGGDAVLLHSSDRAGQIFHRNYRKVYNDILAWAKYFQEKGIREGDRVAMISPKCPRHYLFFYACWRLGIITVPVCETLGADEMSFILHDCEPSLIIADNAMMKKVQPICAPFPLVSLEDLPASMPTAENTVDTAAMAEENERIVPVSQTAPDAVATLIYTSGSTGHPKGVMLTHNNLYLNALSGIKVFHVTPGECISSLLPYWHAYALTVEVVLVPMVGACCAIPRDIRDFRKNLQNYKPDIMLAVPRIVEMLKGAIDKQIEDLPSTRRKLVERAFYNASRIFTAGPHLNGGMLRMFTHFCFYDPLVFRQFRKGLGGKLRCIVCGGAPMDLELQCFFKFIGIPCLVGYGLTETSPIISTNLVEHHKLDTCGPVLPWLLPENGGDFTFKDEEGVLDKKNHGQLLVKGGCVMKGYWKHSDASAKSFEDGWLNTGDMGYYDKDGFIHIAGRKGNMIVTIGGEKLHPEYVEDAIRLSPYITEVMVIGEKCKNVYALVNLSHDRCDGMSDEEKAELARKEVLECTKGLAALQKPKAALVLPDFSQEDGTLTATLKIRRFSIKEKYKAEIEAFLVKNGEEIATRHEVGIAHSKIQESL